MNEGIIPCPFCGGVSIQENFNSPADWGVEDWSKCRACGAAGPVSDSGKELELWNARTPYPGGWFPVTEPLPEGYYWHRDGPDDEFPAPVHSDIINEHYIAYGEFCGPIPAPPKDQDAAV